MEQISIMGFVYSVHWHRNAASQAPPQFVFTFVLFLLICLISQTNCIQIVQTTKKPAFPLELVDARDEKCYILDNAPTDL